MARQPFNSLFEIRGCRRIHYWLWLHKGFQFSFWDSLVVFWRQCYALASFLSILFLRFLGKEKPIIYRGPVVFQFSFWDSRWQLRSARQKAPGVLSILFLRFRTRRLSGAGPWAWLCSGSSFNSLFEIPAGRWGWRGCRDGARWLSILFLRFGGDPEKRGHVREDSDFQFSFWDSCMIAVKV